MDDVGTVEAAVDAQALGLSTISSDGALSARLGTVTLGMIHVRTLLSVYQWLYEKTDGRFTWLAGLPVLLLRTVGAKTGIERTAAALVRPGGGCVQRWQRHPSRVVLQRQEDSRGLRADRPTADPDARAYCQ